MSDKIDIDNSAMDEYDYMELAHSAETADEAREYAEKALEKNKNFLDAKTFLLDFIDDNEQMMKEYEKLIKKTEKQMEKDGLMSEDNIGSFWGIIETRPYMRLRHKYLMLLIETGKYGKALSHCKDLLRLSENDNMGVRYTAMALLAFFEKEEEAKALYKAYDENSMEMIFPLAVLYYKTDQYRQARKYVTKIYSMCDDIAEFLMDEDFQNEVIDAVLKQGMYQYGSAEQFADVFINCNYLLVSTPGFMMWFVDEILKLEDVE